MGNFRQNLREELDYQQLTVKELSAKAQVPKGALDCYLNKQESLPRADTAVKIARALGVSVEYLVTGQESRDGESPPLHPETRRLLGLTEKLSKENRKIILTLAEALKSRQAALP